MTVVRGMCHTEVELFAVVVVEDLVGVTVTVFWTVSVTFCIAVVV